MTVAALLLKIHMDRKHRLITPQKRAVNEGGGRIIHICCVLTLGDEYDAL